MSAPRGPRCGRGHTGRDLWYVAPDGQRHCRECTRIAHRIWYRRRRAERARTLMGSLTVGGMMHLHWLQISERWGWAVMQRTSQICADERRCFRVRVVQTRRAA